MIVYVLLLELPNAPNNIGLSVLKEVLVFIDMFTVVAFSIEIILKFIDNFKKFWHNGWNVFDLIVTLIVSRQPKINKRLSLPPYHLSLFFFLLQSSTLSFL